MRKSLRPENLQPNLLNAIRNKYKNGEIVSERVRPALKLIVNRYVNGIYYCLIQERQCKKELVYFESELASGLS